MINVSIVEAHSIQRIGLKALLESDPSISVTGAWGSLQQVSFHLTDLLVLSYCAVCTPPPMELVASLAMECRVVLYSGKETPVSLSLLQPGRDWLERNGFSFQGWSRA